MRLNYMDNLRAILMLCGVTMHSLMFFTPLGFYSWPVRSLYTSDVFSYFVINFHIFYMSLFYLIAGFFGALIQSRYGWKSFWKQRAKRIGLPFLICMLLLSLYHLGAFINFTAQHKHDITMNDIYYFFGYTMVLWFLYYLLLLYVVMFAAFGFWQLAIPSIIKTKLKVFFAHVYKQWYLVFLLMLPTMVVLLLQQSAMLEPPLDLIPKLDVLFYYFCFFLAGWILYYYQIKEAIYLWRGSWIYFFISLFILFPIYCYPFLQQFYRDSVLWDMLLKILYTLNAWLLCIGLLAFCQYLFNKENKPLKYLADASYWCYLVQIPIIVILQFYFRVYPVSVLIALIGIMGITMLILILSYTWFVRYTWIGVLLNGKKQKKQKNNGANR